MLSTLTIRYSITPVYCSEPKNYSLYVKILVYCSLLVLWKRLSTETSHYGNASKKRTHKNNLMFSSLNLKLKGLNSNDFLSLL